MQATKALIVSLILLGAFAMAQEQSNVTVPQNTIFVGADGVFQADPDVAIVTFDISPQEKSAKSAYDRAARDVEQVRELLRANQIDPKVAQVGFLALQPIYEWNSAKRKVTAYRVNTRLTVKLTDLSKVGPLLDGVENLDITGTQQVVYTLENIDAAKAKAVEDAFSRAKISAAALAKAGGRGLGDLNSATIDVREYRLTRDEYDAEYGKARMLFKQLSDPRGVAPPTQEFTPHSVNVQAHVNAIFNLKPL